MKTFEFNKKINQMIVAQFNAKYHTNITELLALTTIERHYLNDRVFVFKLYNRTNTIYALYWKDKNTDVTILEFKNEKEAYEYILH